MAGQGILVGEVTNDSALVQVRLTTTDRLINSDVPGTEGVVEFTLTSRKANHKSRQVANANQKRDFICRVLFGGLLPDTSYVCETRIGRDAQHLRPGPKVAFKTLAGADAAVPTSLVVVTGMNYARYHGDGPRSGAATTPDTPSDDEAKINANRRMVGYPALEAIADLAPDFFVGTGDNVYYDTPNKDRAKSLTDMRRKWHEQFVQSRYHRLFSQVPTYWEIDDHDFRVDDCDRTGGYEPLPNLARAVMLEQLPYAPSHLDKPITYRTHRISRDLQIWLTENRWYRSPNRAPDGPDKTIWGAQQKAWLKRTLINSTATFKLLISPTPMIGPDDLRKKDNHANIGGFRHERDEFFKMLVDTGVAKQHFYIVCGDRHWQYRSIHPSGIEEFSCGALVDANSRLGRKPGDPKSTDPEGLIRQPYCQDPASGGFLNVVVSPARGSEPARLTFRFFDELGKLLHQHSKLASGP